MGFKQWFGIIVIGVIALPSLNAAEEERCGPYDGVDLTDDPELLEKIFNDHQDWLDSERHKEDPRRANLCGADLAMVNLSWSCASLAGANLSKVNLSNADLSYVDLAYANLSDADLREVNLEGASLLDAWLEDADLSRAWLEDADLSMAWFKRANLSKARLKQANLSNAILKEANLTKAYLGGANLSQARLKRAILSQATLRLANLSNANLIEADLSKAALAGADLSESNLWRANLSLAWLKGADLSKAKLIGADLSGAKLNGANLNKANLREVNLSKASLAPHALSFYADFRDPDFGDVKPANLSKADLTSADLTEVDLERANLVEANLREANLSKAGLVQTDLANAKVTDANFEGARYEPSSAPSKGYLSGITGLDTVWFDNGNQGGLVLLRTGLKEAGLRDLERGATYAIERGKAEYAKGFERWFRLIFFELTSGYGLHYGRPILILLLLIIPFAGIYYFPISGSGGSRLYKIWSEERLEEDEPHDKPKRFIEPLIIDPKNSRLRIIGFALYFSLLSAFHIGWRDLNVGNWITRIQPREYTLRAKGWVRTVSGMQSLISIYLLALWVLVYFGRPFE